MCLNNKMKIFKFILGYILSICICISCFTQINCNDNPVSTNDSDEKSFIGQVIGIDGESLSGVDIHYKFYLDKDLYINDVYLKYSLKNSQEITMNIYNALGHLITSMGGTIQSPGDYSFELGLENFTNGIYKYEVEGKDSLESNVVGEGIFLVFNKDSYELYGRTPLVSSDRYGKFQLKYSALGVNKKFSILVNNKPNVITIADSIDIILYKENYEPLIESFKIDTSLTIRKTFILNKNKKPYNKAF